MRNPFDRWHQYLASHASTDHHTGTLSTTMSTLSCGAGWWELTGSVNYRWGYSSASTASVTSTVGKHQWAEERALCYVPHGSTYYISIIADGSGGGEYHIDRTWGA